PRPDSAPRFVPSHPSDQEGWLVVLSEGGNQSLWSPPTTANDWKSQVKRFAMVTDTGLNVAKGCKAEGLLHLLKNRGWGVSRKVRFPRGKRDSLWSTPPETVSKKGQTMRVSSQIMRIRASFFAKPTESDHSHTQSSARLQEREDDADVVV